MAPETLPKQTAASSFPVCEAPIEVTWTSDVRLPFGSSSCLTDHAQLSSWIDAAPCCSPLPILSFSFSVTPPPESGLLGVTFSLNLGPRPHQSSFENLGGASPSNGPALPRKMVLALSPPAHSAVGALVQLLVQSCTHPFLLHADPVPRAGPGLSFFCFVLCRSLHGDGPS